MSPFRERNRGFTAPKPESPIGRYRADKQRSTARLYRRDARPSRDGSERSGSGTQAQLIYTPYQVPLGNWPQKISVSISISRDF
jgi:hypothetical protein